VPNKSLMSTCVLPLQPFDDSATRKNIFHISHSAGIELLDACIELMVTDNKLQTELKVLSFLLKGRVYPSGLWEIVGERIIEDKQETILREHQSICAGGSKQKEHVIVEHLLMEERKKRGQMEVSLYNQALEHLQQHQTSVHHCTCLFKWDVRSPLATSGYTGAYASLACPTTTQAKCEAWLEGQHKSTSQPVLVKGHEAKRTPVTPNCVEASSPLFSTGVTIDVQKAFCDALHAEQAFQAGLMIHPLTIDGNHVYQRNIGLELLILQAKVRRARAEIELYTVAVENARQFDFSDNIGTLSPSSGFIPRPQPDELSESESESYYDWYRDDVTEGFDNFKFEQWP